MFITYDKAKSDKENLRGLNLAVVKLKTIQVITMCKIMHICCTKPGMTEMSCHVIVNIETEVIHFVI
jgi:hypothetical protein